MMQNEKMIIYQVLPRLFGNLNATPVPNGSLERNGSGKFAHFSSKALEEIRRMGVTHVWYTGIIAHASCTDYSAFGIPKNHADVVKGIAGSPYAIRDYYDVDPDLACQVPLRMQEFEHLVQRTHRAGMQVLIDFVPNHVAREYHSVAAPPYVKDLGQGDDRLTAFHPQNNFYYLPGQPLELRLKTHSHEEAVCYGEFPARVTGNDRFSAVVDENDWYETVKLNYGVDYQAGGATHFHPVPDTWHRMLDILLFWAQKGVDGFRCDMAEMVPVPFWAWAIPQVKAQRPVCFIAEVYSPHLYRSYLQAGGFDYLYDKVGLYDTLRAVMQGQAPAHAIRQCHRQVEDIQPQMLNFLENHDEQRIASRFFAGNSRKGIPALLVSALTHTNPFMLYCGQELGESGMDHEGYSGPDGRTTIFDYWSMASVRAWINNGNFDGCPDLSSDQRALRETYARILHTASHEPAVTKGQFYDLVYLNENNPRFDPDRQYAFLRKYDREALLVIANFDDRERNVDIRLSEEVFHCLGIPQNRAAKVTELLSQQESVGMLTCSWPWQATVPGWWGKVFRFVW